jgi:hypothetical protein
MREAAILMILFLEITKKLPISSALSQCKYLRNWD